MNTTLIKLSIMLVPLILFSFNSYENNNSYKQLWKVVEKYESDGLHRSALNKVEEIFKIAISENNENQIIKSTIFRLKYINILEEDGYLESIKELELQMPVLESVPRSFMHLLLANMYMVYYNRNSHIIDQRSVTHSNSLSDLKTWDKDKFKNIIIKNLMLSIDDVLKTVSINNYSELIKDNKKGAIIFPQLYDFMAYNAIMILNQTKSYRHFPFSSTDDIITEPELMTNAIDFVEMDIEADTLSYNYTIVRIYQKWLKHRISDRLSENNYAYAFTDINRLNFLRQNMNNPDKDRMWKDVLKKLQEKYQNHPTLSMINYELAKYYSIKGKTFSPDNPLKSLYKDYNEIAHKLLEDVTSRYPDAIYYPECKNLKNDIERKSLSFKSEKIVMPKKRTPIKLQYRNLEKVYHTVIKTDYEKWLAYSRLGTDRLLENLISEGKKIVANKEIALPSDKNFNEHSAEYLMDELDKGFYIIIFHHKPNLDINKNLLSLAELFVSELCITSNSSFNENNGYYVLNRESGKPVSGADIKVFGRAYDPSIRENVNKELFSGKTDKNGFIKFKIKDDRRYYNLRINVYHKNDFITENINHYNFVQTQRKPNAKVNIYTDRAIYRPGQIVHFKGICYIDDGKNSNLLSDYSTNIFLRDVNNQEVASMMVKTNEFGSFSGAFTIPLNVLTGTFRIVCADGSHNIQVEEYKRPSFEVNIFPIDKEYRINDSVVVEGDAISYAGVPLSNAKISYNVVRNQRWFRNWMHWIPPAKTDEVAWGELILDEKGRFKITFKATPLFTEHNNDLYYNYTINVNVTDINGETQSGSSSINVSNRSLTISSDIPQIIDKEIFDSFKVITTNISGVKIPAVVNIDIFKLNSPEQLLSPKKWTDTDKKLYSREEWYNYYQGNEYSNELCYNNWEINKKVYTQKINTEEFDIVNLYEINKWDSGIYRLVLKSIDKWGNEIIETEHFTLFSTNSKKMPYLSTSFFYADSDNAQPGDIVSLFVGSSYRNVNLFYSLNVKNQTVKNEIIKMNNEVKTIKIPINEKHRGGVSISLMFIKNGRLYSYNHRINVEWDNKKLDVKLLTFRDKTLPGSKEEWRIKISDIYGNPQYAELLATMYDASLDVFAKNQWRFSYLPNYYSHSLWMDNNFTTNRARLYSRNFYPDNIKSRIVIPSMNLYGFSYLGSFSYRRDLSKMEFALYAESDRFLSTHAAFDEVVPKGDDPPEIVDDLSESLDIQPVQIRRIFEETAFFYPNLVTDENGELFIRFTVPESLTRWNFMGLAHTKDMKIGQIQEQMVTKKELMLSPNLPRFFRENDTIEISARISNISDKTIKGTAKIKLFNPENLESLNKEFLNDNENILEFEVDADKNIAVKWKLSVPQNLSMVGMRIVAVGDKHSDGEERILPVLTNRMLVTETMPLPVRKAGKSSFKMNRLINSINSKTLIHHNLALEFTSNPAWYAVQALPYLMDYPYDCSEHVFSRLYANMLASHIAHSDPKIKRVFELWRGTPDSKTFLSNLEKNQELKSLLLEETPWILQAKDESERKQRIALLFDLNRMYNETNNATKQLQELQQHNGGWPWFKGMRVSRHITQHIVCGFGKLKNLNVFDLNDRQMQNMIQNALSFIDRELVDSYNKLKERCKNDDKCLDKDNIDYIHIHYLYSRSFFADIYAVDNNTEEAFNYYKKQAEKYWTNKNFYMQGMIALSLHRFDKNNKVPAMIIASLKEHSIHHEELGMYWKSDRGFYWYQAPIETQALLIEAFDEIAKDTESIDEMKVWLLKQKQTQDWKTTKATLEAIYALLLRGTELLSNDEIAVIRLGEIVVDTKNAPEIKTEAGTGYFKTSWSGAEIKPEMGNVSVRKSTDNVAWGSLYWQYFEQLDKITHFEETPLKIDKKLFVQRRQGDKSVIVPIEKDNNLTLGDKVTVRIEIRVDRDMEYVHLKDMRGSCFEPVDVISGFRHTHGLGYYQAIKDASVNFFINYLRKGTYVFEYDLIVSQKGNFSNGVTTIQCMYAPEFTSHSEGVRVEVR